MDSRLNGKAQVSAVVKSRNYNLYQVLRVRCYISDKTCKLAVIVSAVSPLDYCNGLLAGVNDAQIKRLQRIQNRAARIVVRPRVAQDQFLHVTPLLHPQLLHWLPVDQRIKYKLCVYLYSCLYELAPPYLQGLLSLRVRDQRLRRAPALERK